MCTSTCQVTQEARSCSLERTNNPGAMSYPSGSRSQSYALIKLSHLYQIEFELPVYRMTHHPQHHA